MEVGTFRGVPPRMRHEMTVEAPVPTSPHTKSRKIIAPLIVHHVRRLSRWVTARFPLEWWERGRPSILFPQVLKVPGLLLMIDVAGEVRRLLFWQAKALM
jgi:hypothetical protein